MMRRAVQVILTGMVVAALVSACARVQVTPPVAQASTPPFLVRYSIREIMDAEVDPSADRMWDSVATISTLAGTQTQQPHTAAEWQAVRRNAITLLEATNLVIMDGRRIAPAGTPLAPGELSPAVLQQKLEASRGQFDGYAVALRGLTLQALDAIDARDAQKLFDVGSEIDEACENCHLAYWYPSDVKAGH